MCYEDRMNRTHLARLRALTRGAALIGLGAAACAKPQSSGTGMVTAPTADSDAAAEVSPGSPTSNDLKVIPFHRRGPILNAPRRRLDSGAPMPAPTSNPGDPPSTP